MFAQLAQDDKAVAHFFRFPGKQRQRHQPGDANVAQVGDVAQKRVRGVCGHAVFAVFVGGVDLHQHVHVPPGFAKPGVKHFRHFNAIQRLKFMGKTHQVFDFIALQMADD